MLHYFKGSVFDSPAKTLVNAVNCVGVLGKGIALEFRLRYEGLDEQYKKSCTDKTLRIGRPKLYQYSDKRWILNFPTKNHWRYPSKLEWIISALEYISLNYKKVNFQSIAFPKLGCENGHLDWDTVKPIMEHYLSRLEIDTYICLDEDMESNGIERAMTEKINNSTINELTNGAKVSIQLAQQIYNCVPYKKFRYLSKIDKISGKAYEKVFKYYYSMCDNIDKKTIYETEQISIFDFNTPNLIIDNTEKDNNIENIRSGDDKKKRKHDEETIRKIIEMKNQGLTQKSISNNLGIPKSTISNILKRHNQV